jgi:hypothetical protein
MADRYDAMTPRTKKDGSTFWHRVGTGWAGQKGIQVVLDSLPIPDAEGRVVINLFEPRERQIPDNQQGRQTQTRQPAYDDDVPGF